MAIPFLSNISGKSATLAGTLSVGGGDSSTAPATKEPYKWPVPLPESELVDESEANERPLQGEGIVDEYTNAMCRCEQSLL